MGKENTQGINPELTSRSASSIDRYLRGSQQSGILRPHQYDVFGDLKRVLEEGYTRLCMELPTGTGKTVLFVEASKALLDSASTPPRPKILVITPTKDLVYQTLGRTGERGYGRFAPNLKVGSFFSDTPYKEKTGAAIDGFDVVVTTYRSLNILSRSREYRGRLDLMAVPTGRTLLDKFNVYIFDEAHHVYGGETAQIVDRIPQDKIAIGLTATPDAGEDKRLIKYFPVKFHTLELNEAIWMGLLAPVVPVGIKSGIRIQGSNLYDESGDFIDSRISYLASDPSRNRSILQAAAILSQNKIGTIISCIAGNEAWHARFLAEQLMRNGVHAAAVYSKVPAEQRQEIYRKFEKGEIDVLTFVGVLGEGWDSQRAKAIINARPTRSLIFSKQRLGRVTRPGDIAFAIDILDEFEDQNPVITVADVLNEGDIPVGRVVGSADDLTRVLSIISSLQGNTPVTPVLESRYKKFEGVLSTLDELNRGILLSKDKQPIPEWAVTSAINLSYSGVSDELFAKIEELTGMSIDKKPARQGNSIRTVYKIHEVNKLLYGLPLIDPNRFFIDNTGRRRISAQGFVLLFSKRFPQVTLDVVKSILDTVDDQLDWIPGKSLSGNQNATHRRYYVTKMYASGQQTINLINNSLSQYFSSSK